MIKHQYIFIFSFIFLLASCAKPVASFIMNQKGDSVPSQIQFQNNSTKATDYEWDFGDGQTSNDKDPKHTYYLSGKYNVTLKASKGEKSSDYKKEIFFKAPDVCLVEMKTSLGTMLIQLYDDTPLHRDNFIKLAEDGYLEELLFHRVIKGFMIQGGDPNSKKAKKGERLGNGGPGYTIDAEFNAKYIHKKGALSAARKGDQVNPKKKSSGSQFYIVQGKVTPISQLERIAAQKGIRYDDEQKQIYNTTGGTPFLDNEYTVFGEVIEGIEVIDMITNLKTDGSDRPLTDVKIISVKTIK